LGGEFGDLELLWGDDRRSVAARRGDRVTGRAELVAGSARPWCGSEALERVVRRRQQLTGAPSGSNSAQPLAEQELNPRQIERPLFQLASREVV